MNDCIWVRHIFIHYQLLWEVTMCLADHVGDDPETDINLSDVLHVWASADASQGITDDDTPSFNASHSPEGAACKVKLFDITCGLPQCIESQYRTHWMFAPALWNLTFVSVSIWEALSAYDNQTERAEDDRCETDVAIAGADLFQKLEHGTYRNRGKRYTSVT